ncbi:hypothetical protein MARPO_0094s0029 [Marchantia polymorpha]|uniref:Uncharacterized protein n=1 Tax=Marchantia polymorpha TaxID=3197 RepID=A0A2R6WG69_MARPO|nr:hypothetical protein MARPO_0094s0029 [Marchantia polymorpha]|eukprot:PTQ32852.1 hypothetical protein MARPO_0094s0029 [Marchantia polymorpha]
MSPLFVSPTPPSKGLPTPTPTPERGLRTPIPTPARAPTRQRGERESRGETKLLSEPPLKSAPSPAPREGLSVRVSGTVRGGAYRTISPGPSPRSRQQQQQKHLLILHLPQFHCMKSSVGPNQSPTPRELPSLYLSLSLLLSPDFRSEHSLNLESREGYSTALEQLPSSEWIPFRDSKEGSSSRIGRNTFSRVQYTPVGIIYHRQTPACHTGGNSPTGISTGYSDLFPVTLSRRE